MTNTASQYSDLHILVIDDKEFIRSMMRRILEGLGINQVVFAANGNEALATLWGDGPRMDIVFCDLRMPDMDGIELVRHVAELLGLRPSFSFVSGTHPAVISTTEAMARARGINVLGSIPKPISREAVIQILEQFMAGVLRDKLADAVPAGFAFMPSKAELETAIVQGQLETYYQPKQNLATGKPEGFESLVRWRHPDHGIILPGAFIGLAERTGLIGPLTDWVMNSVFEQCAIWNKAGLRTKISVNLSAHMLVNLTLPDHLAAKAARAGIDPHQLVMEITETGVFGDTADTLDILARLHLKGFTLSIDDFGTGYSSMEQLRRVPFAEMKIDRAFVNRCAIDSRIRAILESSVRLARGLGMSIVAEGAETRADVELLKEIGLDLLQGFYYAKPMPAADAFTWAQTR